MWDSMRSHCSSTDLSRDSAQKQVENADVSSLIVCHCTLLHRCILWGLVLVRCARRLVSTTMASCSLTVDMPGMVSIEETSDFFNMKKTSRRKYCLVGSRCSWASPFSADNLKSFSQTLGMRFPGRLLCVSQQIPYSWSRLPKLRWPCCCRLVLRRVEPEKSGRIVSGRRRNEWRKGRGPTVGCGREDELVPSRVGRMCGDVV